VTKKKVAVLISGNGSNLQALMDACKDSDYPAEIALVISNKPDAFGLTRAAQSAVKSLVINHKEFDTRESFDEAMHQALISHNIEIVCLAGFMRLLSASFVGKWQDRMINIHPSLLPKYKGANAISNALAAGEKITGCTVHYVVPEMDAGEIILQKQVPILAGDTLETLTLRMHETEHKAYPAAVRIIIQKNE